ncbi:MAG: sigma-70 family RNA polymerase sigma factor [Naasia sp.]
MTALDAAPDALLAQRAADGDEVAFTVIVRRHGPYLRAFATRLLRSNSDADDVVQEAFIQAWRRLPDLQDPAALRSWLTTMVSRKVTDRIRATRPTDPIDDLELTDLLSGPEDQAIGSSRLRALARVLDTLPADQRQIWLLREVAGHSYTEISDRLGIPTPTVRGRLARARAHVLDRMSDWR